MRCEIVLERCGAFDLQGQAFFFLGLLDTADEGTRSFEMLGAAGLLTVSFLIKLESSASLLS